MTKQEAQDKADMIAKAIDETLDSCGGIIVAHEHDHDPKFVRVQYRDGNELKYAVSLLKNISF